MRGLDQALVSACFAHGLFCARQQMAPGAFTQPFDVFAEGGKLWIRPLWDEGNQRSVLHIKGVNWSGFQASGCPHELWKHHIDDYVHFLQEHRFNAVRLCAKTRRGSNCPSHAALMLRSPAEPFAHLCMTPLHHGCMP